MNRQAVLALGLAAMAGCAGPSQEMPMERMVQRQVQVERSYDETWNSVVEWFALQDTPIDKLDKESGLITSERGLGADVELDCGEARGRVAWAAAKMENVTGNINVVVRRLGPNSTRVLISANGEGEVNVRNGLGQVIKRERATCVSTGVLENSLASYLLATFPEVEQSVGAPAQAL